MTLRTGTASAPWARRWSLGKGDPAEAAKAVRGVWLYVRQVIPKAGACTCLRWVRWVRVQIWSVRNGGGWQMTNLIWTRAELENLSRWRTTASRICYPERVLLLVETTFRICYPERGVLADTTVETTFNLDDPGSDQPSDGAENIATIMPARKASWSYLHTNPRAKEVAAGAVVGAVGGGGAWWDGVGEELEERRRWWLRWWLRWWGHCSVEALRWWHSTCVPTLRAPTVQSTDLLNRTRLKGSMLEPAPSTSLLHTHTRIHPVSSIPTTTPPPPPPPPTPDVYRPAA